MARGNNEEFGELRLKAGCRSCQIEIDRTTARTTRPEAAKKPCSAATTCARSPTDAATRLTGPERTSPMANTPGQLVSSKRRLLPTSAPVNCDFNFEFLRLVIGARHQSEAADARWKAEVILTILAEAPAWQLGLPARNHLCFAINQAFVICLPWSLRHLNVAAEDGIGDIGSDRGAAK